MKKFLLIIILLFLNPLNMVSGFANVNEIMCDTTIGSKELEVKNNSVWSGKEWITTEYPPSVSSDGINFSLVDGSYETKNIFKNTNIVYVWTGNDYLVYHSNKSHTYMAYNVTKHLYRLSKDLKTILNIYDIPEKRWINSINIVDDRYYISTEQVLPKYENGEGSRVYGETFCNFEIYYTSNFEDWEKLYLPFELQRYDLRPSVLTLNNKELLIVNYELGKSSMSASNEYYQGLRSKNIGFSLKNGEVFSIKYECLNGNKIENLKNYFYTEICDSNKEQNRIAFSKDGVYWVELLLYDQKRLLNVFESEDNVVIKCLNDGDVTYSVCNKEVLYSKLDNILIDDNIIIRLNDKILGFETPPITENDRTLVPMRFLFEQMGAEVEWDEQTETATATMASNPTQQMTTFGTQQENRITFSIDNTNATVNGQEEEMDVPARLINDKIMVPLRFLSENLGCTVTWDESTNTAIVTTE